MPNGFTDRQAEELDVAAGRFAANCEDVLLNPLPSIAMREATGETVFLFEKVEAYLSKLRPTNRAEKKARGAQHAALAHEWELLKKEALKRAKAP